ncbi:MAG: MFS transporter, partial [Gammaproteobacteria bacterium]|nr:MFS transporter [Gammaproteobacteria bacterium]
MNKVSRLQLTALALPAMPMFAMMMPVAIFLPSHYAHLGFGMAAVGTVFLAGRTFDVITDPIAGMVMDRMRHRVPRKAWVAIGAAPIWFSVLNLFFVDGTASLTGLLFWILVLYLGWTLSALFKHAGPHAGDQ